jgi:glycosyltransferase involved in cell wall biosynthesis
MVFMSKPRRLAQKLAGQLLPVGSKRRLIAGRLYRRIRRRPEPFSPQTYQQWIDTVEPQTVSPLVTAGYRPKISIVVPAFNTPDKYLVPLLDSVMNQSYDNWELILVQGSTDAERAKAIRATTTLDSRIKVPESGIDHGIAANTNVGIKTAIGEYIGFLDHDDLLAPSALNEVVAALQSDRRIDWLYSDEDKLSDDGTQRMPFFFKPDWSPDLFMSVNYVTHFSVVRASFARKVGGIRIGFEGAQDFDFALRLLEENPKIYHIPKVLYHWRYADGSTAIHPHLKNTADNAGVRALNEYLQRNSIAAVAEGMTNAASNYHVKYATPGNPKASLIIPFLDKPEVTRVMVDSILSKTIYADYEILLIDNRSRETATAEFLASLASESRVRIINYSEPFNWSAVNNFGRREATGEVLVFLNNDMEVLNPEWLTELVGVAIQPNSGAVGALLNYPTNPATIQHAGVVLGLFGVAGHVFRGLTTGNFTLFGLPEWPRNYLAVTGACIAVTAEKFDQVKGFDENFNTAGSDVAFGIALYRAGYRNIYWPFARLMHYENTSVGVYDERTDSEHDYQESMKYYRPYLEGKDPYFNPNFELHDPLSEQIKLKGLK